MKPAHLKALTESIEHGWYCQQSLSMASQLAAHNRTVELCEAAMANVHDHDLLLIDAIIDN